MGKPDTPYVPVKPSTPATPETPYVPAKPDTPASPEVPHVPQSMSYTKVDAVPSYKPTGYYSKPPGTTKAYQPVQATANAAVQNGVAGAGVFAAAFLAFL